MRGLLLVAAFAVSACEMTPPPAAEAVPPPPPAPVVAAVPPLPPAAAQPAVPFVLALPRFVVPRFVVPSFVAPPAPGQLILHNFSMERARVVTVVTTSPDCGARSAGEVETSFELPLNGSRVVMAPPGADVCWRRELEPAPAAAAAPRWSGWNRAYLSVAGSVDSRL